ncbi:lysozyme inhibitor LprI family protein [Mesorhizobium sp. B2-6-2]|uniref:lysozyme inhibitor LprI family protein n=1 Tax=Mesorhizobium sp. B2-6-2 TaxID=2589915 RepID=UPI00112B3B23|nr:lysozyme inhibitor LprI family protein [Mesorhizobium sp. B2-6-2]TPJ82310.1 DUF1311 domain-containing protein [Mesorhizobium sp. B2-6-2]
MQFSVQRLAMTFFFFTALFATSGAFADDKDVMVDTVKRHICPDDLRKYEILDIHNECYKYSGIVACKDINMGSKSWYDCMNNSSGRFNQCANDVSDRNKVIIAYNTLMSECAQKRQDAETQSRKLMNKANSNAKPDPSIGQTAAPAKDFHPSFNCAKASTNVELTICNVERLSSADNNLDSAYKQLMERVRDPKEIARIRKDQGAFLAKRNRCKTPICIDDSYTARTDELYDEIRAANDEVTSQPAPDDPLASSLPNANDVGESVPQAAPQPVCMQRMAYASCLTENDNRKYCWLQFCCYPKFRSVHTGDAGFNQCEREYQQSGQ